MRFGEWYSRPSSDQASDICIVWRCGAPSRGGDNRDRTSDQCISLEAFLSYVIDHAGRQRESGTSSRWLSERTSRSSIADGTHETKV
jgi:hypothetical protein